MISIYCFLIALTFCLKLLSRTMIYHSVLINHQMLLPSANRSHKGKLSAIMLRLGPRREHSSLVRRAKINREPSFHARSRIQIGCGRAKEWFAIAHRAAARDNTHSTHRIKKGSRPISIPRLQKQTSTSKCRRPISRLNDSRPLE